MRTFIKTLGLNSNSTCVSLVLCEIKARTPSREACEKDFSPLASSGLWLLGELSLVPPEQRFFSLWVATIRKHIFPVVLGTDTQLSSKIAVIKLRQK